MNNNIEKEKGMNSEKLSQRLDNVAKFVVKYSQKPIRLADIGSDHAYLPCHLALNNHLEFGIAGEVVEGPFRSAQNEVTFQGLNQLIEVRKGDGLAVVNFEDKINTITICGMGGVLIRDILASHPNILKDSTTLVLQPNIASYQLRQWLNLNHFEIIDETVIEDHDRQYEIIVAQKHLGKIETLSEKELIFGPLNLASPSEFFFKKWVGELKVIENVYQEIVSATNETHQKAIDLKKQIELIKEVLIK